MGVAAPRAPVGGFGPSLLGNCYLDLETKFHKIRVNPHS